MRLVKLFSILLCIVFCISLSTITVFAERVEENGWYNFTTADLVDVFTYTSSEIKYENKAFPIYSDSGYYGAQNGYYIDLLYNIGSSNGWINVPSGYTLEIETRVTYYRNNVDGVASVGFDYAPIFFTAFGEDSSSDPISVQSSNYTPQSGRPDIAVFKLNWTNNTGRQVDFSKFRYGATSGFEQGNVSYSINITWIRFRLLNSNEVMTDQILNGWGGSGNTPPEQEKVDEVGGVEEEVLGKVEDGASEAGTLFNDFGSQLLAFVPAFTVIGRCFGNFMEIPLLSALLFIGLTIGVSGFLLGILPSVASAIRGNQMAKQHAERRSSNTSSNNKGSQKG